MNELPTPSLRRSQLAVRLTFAYAGKKLQLVSQQPLVKRVPLSSPQKIKNESGFWIEISDKQGKLLYRRILQNPLQTNREVFSNDPKTGIVRVPVSQPKGRFFVIVPEIERAASITVMSSPFEKEKQLQPATSIATFTLRNTKEKGGKK